MQFLSITIAESKPTISTRGASESMQQIIINVNQIVAITETNTGGVIFLNHPSFSQLPLEADTFKNIAKMLLNE